MAARAVASPARYCVYALAARGLPRRFVAGGRPLRAVDIDEVCAVVEIVTEPRPATEQALREQHAIVVQLASRVDALLPVRFGTCLTRAELDARVKSAHDQILEALERARGRVQMTIRVQSASTETSPAARFSSGTAYLAARSERERALRRAAAKIRRAVSRFVVDERVEPGKGALPGTVYHLIHARDVDHYRAAVERGEASLAPARLLVTGPWPVFAFVPELGRE